jgi:bifunctional DNA-binding transcriptional regulator/antitoxin component of YhaV-PrlF toxin-antitoxin module
MSHKFKGDVKVDSESPLMWNCRIFIPDDIMDDYKDTSKRVKCIINNQLSIQCALHSNGDGTYYILLNKEIRKKLKLNEGDEVQVEMELDKSKYGIFTPNFFEELCFQDPEADKLFHQLTPGKQRTLLHLIGKLKSEQKQLEKALIIFDYLKEVNGKLDFKELNEAFKENRFRK